MASVPGIPEDQLIGLASSENAAAATAAADDAGIDISKLRFRYVITGDNPPWGGRFPPSMTDPRLYEMPRGSRRPKRRPLFVIGPEGDGQLVNYRVAAKYYIRRPAGSAPAELRLGGEHQQTVVSLAPNGRLW